MEIQMLKKHSMPLVEKMTSKFKETEQKKTNLSIRRKHKQTNFTQYIDTNTL